MSDNWYVYILECCDGSLYTGITNDVDKRMIAHESGSGSKYVARKGFAKLLHVIKIEDKSSAAKLEYAIKHLPRHKKIDFFLNHANLES